MQLYRTLGLAPNADAGAIRNAYRALAKRYHPDVSTEPDAHARFVAIAEAYQVLSNPEARARYDRTWQRAAARAQQPQRPGPPKPTTAAPRYNRSYSKERHQARAQAEAQSRMSYAEFDRYAFATVAGYVAPKMLGCLGIGVVAMAISLLLIGLASLYEALMMPVVLILFFSLIPGIAYASTRFDAWHDQRQVRRRMGRK